MNIKALVAAAVVIGSSSLALAQPGQGGVQVTTTTTTREVVRDHRDEQPNAYKPVFVKQPLPAWNHRPVLQTLATTKLINGKDVIRFSGSKSLSAIKLEATKGRTQVSQVKIKFANGQSQIVYPNKVLTASDCIDIDLTGNVRDVTGITVLGSASMRSSFEILGA